MASLIIKFKPQVLHPSSLLKNFLLFSSVINLADPCLLTLSGIIRCWYTDTSHFPGLRTNVFVQFPRKIPFFLTQGGREITAWVKYSSSHKAICLSHCAPFSATIPISLNSTSSFFPHASSTEYYPIQFSPTKWT